VVKIALGYDFHEAEEQALITAYITNNSTIKCCCANKIYESDPIKYITSTNDYQPVFFLSFVNGVGGNHLIEKELYEANLILSSVAFNLSKLHSIPIINCNLRSILHSGGVFTSLHVSGSIKLLLESSEFNNHPYVMFYLLRYQELINDLTLEDLPVGILHGDPFLDNVHFIEETGAFNGFVDFEDSCVGPMIFDIRYNYLTVCIYLVI
jgi:aminoglycoside phosphotransferase